MKWQSYQLENTILKAKETWMLLQAEKGIVEINKNTLAIPIRIYGEQKGYVFHGRGRLILDTIVETHKGAIGKPVEKEINKPFLMLGSIKEAEHLIAANKEDLIGMGFRSEQEFMTMAEDLCHKFFGKERLIARNPCGKNDGVIFAFQNKTEGLDTLVIKGSKLVYKAVDKVFVLTQNKAILKTPTEIILSSDMGSYVIKKDFQHRNCTHLSKT